MPQTHPTLARADEVVRPALTLYLDVHRNPELSGEERRTAALFADRLPALGCEVTRGIGGHGVVGELRNGEGPRVYVRAELDALPLEEATGLRYASDNGAMRACGHDLHLAAAAGTADLLARTTAHWRGTLVVLGQLGRGDPDGSPRDAGRRPVRALRQTGRRPGPAHGTAARGNGRARQRPRPGRRGERGPERRTARPGRPRRHPHLTVDPVVTAAAVISRLQTVVSRESAPAEQVTLTVGTVRAGTAVNVVPDTAELGIGLRALTDESLNRALAAVERIVRAECGASACPREPDLTTVSRSPALWGDPATTRAIRNVHTALYGPQRVGTWPPSMAAEDFPSTAMRASPCTVRPESPWSTGCSGPRAQSSGPSPPHSSRPTIPPISPRTSARPCPRRSPH